MLANLATGVFDEEGGGFDPNVCCRRHRQIIYRAKEEQESKPLANLRLDMFGFREGRNAYEREVILANAKVDM